MKIKKVLLCSILTAYTYGSILERDPSDQENITSPIPSIAIASGSETMNMESYMVSTKFFLDPYSDCKCGNNLNELEERESMLSEEENQYSVTDTAIKSLFSALPLNLRNDLALGKEGLVRVKIGNEQLDAAFYELDERNKILKIAFFELNHGQILNDDCPFCSCFYILMHDVVDAVLKSKVFNRYLESQKNNIKHVVFYGYKTGGAMAHIASLKAGSKQSLPIFKDMIFYSIAYHQFPAFTRRFHRTAAIDNKRHVTFTSAEVYSYAISLYLPGTLTNIGLEHSILQTLSSNSSFQKGQFNLHKTLLLDLFKMEYNSINKADIAKGVYNLCSSYFSWTPSQKTESQYKNEPNFNWANMYHEHYRYSKELLTQLETFAAAKDAFTELNRKSYYLTQNQICADELIYQLNNLQLGSLSCNSLVLLARSTSANLMCSLKYGEKTTVMFRYEISFEGNVKSAQESFFKGENILKFNKCIKETKNPLEAGYERFAIINPFDSGSQNIVLTPQTNPTSKCIAKLEISTLRSQLKSLLNGTDEERKAFEVIYGPTEPNGTIGLFADSCRSLLLPFGFPDFDSFKYSIATKTFLATSKDRLDELFEESSTFEGKVEIASAFTGSEFEKSLNGIDLSECFTQPYKNCKDGAFRTVPGECPVACLLSPTDLNCARVFKCRGQSVFLSVRGDSVTGRWSEAISFKPEASESQFSNLISEMGRYTTFLYHSSFSYIRSRTFITIFHE